MRKARAKSGGQAARRGAFKRLRPPSLTEQAYQAIKDRIVTLVFSPGQYLNEATICDLLGMGRTPVHQALQRLKVEGLVEIVPRKGIIVQPDSIGRIIEILDARMMIEPELARRAAEKATDADVAYLEDVLHCASRGNGAAAIDSYTASDRAFHVKIATMSGNQVLGDFLKSLHERSTRFWYLHLWQTLDSGGSEQEHGAVLEAIRARDGADAAEAMEAHIDRLRGRLIKIRDSGPWTAIQPVQR